MNYRGIGTGAASQPSVPAPKVGDKVRFRRHTPNPDRVYEIAKVHELYVTLVTPADATTNSGPFEYTLTTAAYVALEPEVVT